MVSKRDKVWWLLGRAYNVFFMASEIFLFVLAISTLWGWWFIGLGSCLILIARVVDSRQSFRKIVLYKSSYESWLRKYVLFFLFLASMAILVNAVFFLAYFLGFEVPYDSDPMHPPSATWVQRN